ncbi:hypothetical protein Baya_8467 [Bagarius yarrelli]|uniref:Uncharacterized protein n=1 Tax=Bagarius yarrelli TaxID=175774 RepID=A0A556U5Q5_BAGYA|nr:hypothetical protein Baya_8467 [Bagarius yarrelli]
MPLCFRLGCLYASVTLIFGHKPEIDLYTDRVFIKTAGPCCFSIWPCIKTEEFVDIPSARRTVFPHSGTIDRQQTESVGPSAYTPDKTIKASFKFAVNLSTELIVGRQIVTAVASYFKEAATLQNVTSDTVAQVLVVLEESLTIATGRQGSGSSFTKSLPSPHSCNPRNGVIGSIKPLGSERVEGEIRPVNQTSGLCHCCNGEMNLTELCTAVSLIAHDCQSQGKFYAVIYLRAACRCH